MSETKLRPVKAIKMDDILPAMLDDEGRPEFEWVDPTQLVIEEKYQRNISEKSHRLIRNIVKNFQWTRFKPPVCVWGPNDKLYVIDGQHTAIAAASHPKMKKIPVMIVIANTMKDRAESFMSHNRDRVAVTSTQLYYSAVAAEDEVALAVKKALDTVGAVVVRYNPPIWAIGQTMAVGIMSSIAQRKGHVGLTRVLKILIDAKRAPVSALEITSVADLLWGKEWMGKFDDYDLVTCIRSKTPDQWRSSAEANVRKGTSMPMKRAMAITWYRHVPKSRGKNKKGIKIKSL